MFFAFRAGNKKIQKPILNFELRPFDFSLAP
jgi:hypothetical protein